MVRMGDMLKKQKPPSLTLGKKKDEANRMFHKHATALPVLNPQHGTRIFHEDGTPRSGPQGVNFVVFRQLMTSLVQMANDEADKVSVREGTAKHSRFPRPSSRDLKAAFKISDVDKNEFVTEEEFMRLFSLVIADKVRGLGGGIEFYRRPCQLMQWGDEDFHPDPDWQDLFFDLLFAGSAFCGAGLLAESLVNGQAAEGFLWFVVMFLCLGQQWVMRIHLCSRFASTSFVHAIFVEELEFVCIALATWHIPLVNKTKDISTGLSYSSSYGSSYSDVITFTPVDQLRANIDGCASGFSFFLAINCLVYVGRWAEVLADPAASRGAKSIARYSMWAYSAVALVFFGAAALCAASNESGDDGDYSNETPAWCLEIWAAAHLLFIGFLVYWAHSMGAKSEAEARAESVPMSVGYLIIRVGEWTMVMLGETVLSMLGIPLKSDVTVYFMFACSMLIAGTWGGHGYFFGVGSTCAQSSRPGGSVFIVYQNR